MTKYPDTYSEMPITQALEKWAEKQHTRFFMPGHKGCGPLEGFLSLDKDLTEIADLDDLHNPAGVVLASEEKLSDIFGTGRTLALVNGAGSGLKGVLLAHGDQGPVVVPRNAHRAILEGLILSGADPIYVFPEAHEGFWVPASPQQYQEYSSDHLLVMLAETYEGFIRDYQTLETDCTILADEAHGSHLRFCGVSSALDWADYTVHGAHKTLGSLTQSGFIHVKDGQQTANLRRHLQLVVSTSPSWLLLSSLERAAQWWSHFENQEEWLERAHRLKEDIDRIPGMRTLFETADDSLMVDPFRLTIQLDVRAEGKALGALLRERFAVEMEMSNDHSLVAILTPFDEPGSWEALRQSLGDISRMYHLCDHFDSTSAVDWTLPEKCMRPREAFWREKHWIDLKHACGRISGDIVVAYPPGIPLLYPGERIGREQVNQVTRLEKSGGQFQGLHVGKVLVVKE